MAAPSFSTWTPERLAVLREHYPTAMAMSELRQRIADAAPGLPTCSPSAIHMKGRDLGLRRDPGARTTHRKDIAGLTFAKLRVIEAHSYSKEYRELLWRCECTCGAEVVTSGSNLRGGRVTQCKSCTRQAMRERAPLIARFRRPRPPQPPKEKAPSKRQRVWTEARIEVLHRGIADGLPNRVIHRLACAVDPDVPPPSLSGMRTYLHEKGISNPAGRKGRGTKGRLTERWTPARDAALREMWGNSALTLGAIVEALAKIDREAPVPARNTVMHRAQACDLPPRPLPPKKLKVEKQPKAARPPKAPKSPRPKKEKRAPIRPALPLRQVAPVAVQEPPAPVLSAEQQAQRCDETRAQALARAKALLAKHKRLGDCDVAQIAKDSGLSRFGRGPQEVRMLIGQVRMERMQGSAA